MPKDAAAPVPYETRAPNRAVLAATRVTHNRATEIEERDHPYPCASLGEDADAMALKAIAANVICQRLCHLPGTQK